jgi:putative membrane protein
MTILHHLQHFLQSTQAVISAEFRLFKRFPRLKAAVIAVAMVPAVYALIYLSSVWDPNAKTSDLPVGFVNLDAGINYQGQQANLGRDLGANLVKKGSFGFKPYADQPSVHAAVSAGVLAFAVVIPADFSAMAVPGATQGGGTVKVILSEGNNYSSAGFAKRFAAELGHQMNETLNEKRWALVLSNVDGSGKSLGRLQAGVVQLKAGAHTLREGSVAYSRAAQQVAGGFKQVGAGVKTLDAKWPADADVQMLKSGTQQLTAGQRELGKGLETLQAGAVKLTEGAGNMRDETASVPFAGAKISKGAGDLAAGGAQLGDGLGKAKEANAQLAQGAGQLDAGLGQLVEGMGALGGGVKTIASKLPEDSKLDEFAAGGQALSDGAAKLLGGIEALEASLPKSVPKLDGSARGLADSVEPLLEVLAPVANNGSAFVPNMLSVALWLGVVLCVNLFNLRTVLTHHANLPRFAKVIGKISVPVGIIALQVVLACAVVVLVLGLSVPDYPQFVLTMLAASCVFLALVFALLRVFGEAGKLVAVLLLTLQLAAGGGVLPIELSGNFFRTVHDWLPFTWVVKAFRISLFGAFDGEWWAAMRVVLGSGLVALIVATWVGRWRVVPEADFKPAIEV